MIVDRTSSPHITVIVGSAGLRSLLATFIQLCWPLARIEEIDPFSQTMPGGASPVFGTASDLVILGGIGTESEALNSIKRLRSRQQCPAIVLVVSPLLLASTSTFLAAGANHVLNRESLSAMRLSAAIRTELHGGEGVSMRPLPQTGSSNGTESTELIVNGQRYAVHFDGVDNISVLASTPLAQVLSARDIATGQKVVVKIATVAPLHDPVALNAVCDRLRFFSTLNDPHLVRFLDFGVVHSWPYSVLEYIAGGDLRQRLAAPLTPAIAIDHVCSLAAALQGVHAGRLAHMDIKPENLFFRTDDTLVLIDYNISLPFGATARQRQNDDVLGTPTYMSPEQGQGLVIDGRSDLYSVGVIFFEMLTGAPPFQGENAAQILYRHIHDEIPYLPKRVRGLQPIIDKLLEKRPEDRYHDVNALIANLTPWRTRIDFAADD